MKKTLYEVLQVSASADADVIEAAYSRIKQKLQASSSPDAQNDLKILQQSFDTLSNPERRAAYDRGLLAREQPNDPREATRVPSSGNVTQYRSEWAEFASEWWNHSKTTGVIVAAVLLIAAGLLFNYAKDSRKTDVAREQVKNEQRKIEATQTTEGRRVENEGALFQGVVDNQGRIIDLSSDIAKRDLDMRQQQQEARLRERAAQLEMQRDAHETRMKERALQQERSAETRSRHDEQRAAAAAQAQLDRDRAELCRMERNRYGRAISCN